MANVNASVSPIAPIVGANKEGYILGWLNSASKVAQNDTITITNAKVVDEASVFSIDAAGTVETKTIASNVVTLTSTNTAKTISGLVVYLPK
jgi:hypothetical protein